MHWTRWRDLWAPRLASAAEEEGREQEEGVLFLIGVRFHTPYRSEVPAMNRACVLIGLFDDNSGFAVSVVGPSPNGGTFITTLTRAYSYQEAIQRASHLASVGGVPVIDTVAA